ncbi:MAG: hypothetical protein HQL13_04610 [Candidatus Omnitrophica bacterium]|nr:hypothetical protein [Candidatus Omnitrophota bacterium]
MLRNFLKNRKAQNTAEYALLIAMVVAAVIAMQTFIQRALQGRMHDGATYLAQQTNDIGNAQQYEPYYSQSNYQVNSAETDSKRTGSGLIAADTSNQRQRTGSQTTTYDKTQINQVQ